ncbi:hypothetical protein [Xanthobacter versatilis]|uniref:hypothetical protein n=1 Tax=Xanthobacter autotrophicus (strain ATCC BAA-1158 / Py2) TaxID=78245 RepID=UPI003726CD3C
MTDTTKAAQTIAEALNRVHGKPVAPEPANLAEALSIVRGSGAKPPEPTKKAAPVSAKGEPLPGLRAWLQERRDGRS